MRDVTLRAPLHLDRFIRNTRFRFGPDFEAAGTPQPWAAVTTHGYDLWDCEVVGEWPSGLHPSDLGGTMASGQPWSVSGIAVTGRLSQLRGVSVRRAPEAGLWFGPSHLCDFQHVTLSECFNGIYGEWWGQYTPPTDPTFQKFLPTQITGRDFSIRDLWGWRLTDAQMASSGLWRGYPAGLSNYRGREHVVGNDGLVGIFRDSLFERFVIGGEMKAGIKFSQATNTTIRDFAAGHLMNQGTFSPAKAHPDGNPKHYVFPSTYIPVQPGTILAQDGTLDPRLSSRGYYDLGGTRTIGMNVLQASFPGKTRLENVSIFAPDKQLTGGTVFAAIESWLHRVHTSGCRLVRRDPQASEPMESLLPPDYLSWLEPVAGGVLVPWGGSSIEHGPGFQVLVQPERA